MKKRISIVVLGLLMGTTLIAQYNTADKNSGCKSCGVAGSGIFAYKYVADNKVSYKITECVPFSDIEIYSSPSGGAVVSYVTADEKGEALVTLSEKQTAAFALNHSRVNEKGASGKGQVFNLSDNPVLDIESPLLNADNINSVTVSWKANSFGANWVFNVQRSVTGKNFETVATMASGNSGAMRTYTTKNAVSGSGAGAVYYRIEARNDKTGAVILTDVKDLSMPKAQLFTTMIINNQVRIHFSDLVSYPATYSVADVSGVKVATGVLKSNDQVIDISSYQVKNYILSITDSKNNLGSQVLFKN